MIDIFTSWVSLTLNIFQRQPYPQLPLHNKCFGEVLKSKWTLPVPLRWLYATHHIKNLRSMSVKIVTVCNQLLYLFTRDWMTLLYIGNNFGHEILAINSHLCFSHQYHQPRGNGNGSLKRWEVKQWCKVVWGTYSSTPILLKSLRSVSWYIPWQKVVYYHPS